MYPLALIGLPEIGYIIAIASVIFGVTAVLQNPFISKGQKGLWILTILALNWIGLLWYYYVFTSRISNKRQMICHLSFSPSKPF
ncbi:MAG: hypothetical protein LRY33_03465, partial [Parabacteroides chartae]|nr:hypothetical protein [Parabacteroides chartae]